MHVEIRARLRPYSHTPGVSTLLPGTLWIVRAFPDRLQIEDLSGSMHYEGPLQLSGHPKGGFTVQQDLERQRVVVFGYGGRVELRVRPEGIELWQHKEMRILPLTGPRVGQARERLSLGMHKAQDWDAIRRRWDLREILPLLYCLGQQTPSSMLPPSKDSFLEEMCMHLLSPRGVVPSMLAETMHKIRALFIYEEGDSLQLLPTPPISFDSGRFVGVEWRNTGEIDFEWTKGKMRRLVLRAQWGGMRTLCFPKELQSFRLRSMAHSQGKSWNNGQPIPLIAGMTYVFDRFQK